MFFDDFTKLFNCTLCNQCINSKKNIDKIIEQSPKSKSEFKLYKFKDNLNNNGFISEEKRRGIYDVKKELESKMLFETNKNNNRIPI
jgi:hypothetical protein